MYYDLWEPFFGCRKKSEACLNCPRYTHITNFKEAQIEYLIEDILDYPLKKDKTGTYIVPDGALLRVCVQTSDFFYEGMDPYREKIWNIMRQRPKVIFYLLTKRPERVLQCLPSWWNTHPLNNVILNVTCENQKRADERLPILKELPFHHKGIGATPLLEEINIKKYLQEGWIEQVKCSGEQGSNARECNYEWVKKLSQQCKETNVKFTFFMLGDNFIKDNKKITFSNSFEKAIYTRSLKLNILETQTLYNNQLFKPDFIEQCSQCSVQPVCSGFINKKQCPCFYIDTIYKGWYFHKKMI